MTRNEILSFPLQRRLLLVREQINREGGEPVFAGVVAAGDVSKRGGGVFVCGHGKDLARRVTLRQRLRDASHTPRTTEIQTIEMDQLRIRAISDERRL